MKYRYLSIILLILIFSVGAVCAQDNAADIISAGSDDVISIEEAPVLQDNGSSADEIHINDANFNQYFDESGTMNDNVSADSTIFIGEITNKSLYINKPVDIVPDDTSKITDSIITLISGSDGSTINGLTFNNNIIGAVEIDNAIDVAVIGNIINIVSNSNITHPAISALYANNLNVTANTITYNGKSDGENAVVAMVITESENAVIEDNEFTINIPSNIIDWIEDPPGSWNYVANPRSAGIMVTNSNSLSFKRNAIYLNATDVFGSDDSIYVVDIVDSDEVQFNENEIIALGHNYIYGLVISGESIDIIGNSISILSDTNYANGIDIEGGSSAVVEDNYLYIISPNVAYPVYSAANWGTGESPDVDYLYNHILADSDVVYGMHLTGTDSTISGNTISIFGNYTMGIYSYMDDVAIIHNNKINVYGEKNDTKSTADKIPAQTVGILTTGVSEIHNNVIKSDGNYTVVNSNVDSEIFNNYLTASELVGDESVDDKSDDAIVENNIPNSENKYNLTNDTFFLYFDEYGGLRDGITGELTFIGEFSNLVKEIFITEQVNLLSDNATLYNMGIEIFHSDLIVDGFNFVSDSLNEVICVENANNVYIMNNNFTVNGVFNDDNDVIHILNSEDTRVDNNTINFAVETNETHKNTAINAIDSDGVHISNNTITALLPSRSIDWTSGEVYSEVVSLDGCNDAILADNVILVKSNGNIGEYDTIYAVHVTGDDALVVRNSIGVAEAPYGYGLVIAGEDFIIGNNIIVAAQNGTYVCGIDVESNSNGIIDSNFIIAYGESAYAIYTADWAGDVKVNITNNEIVTNGTNVFGMSLSGSEATVDNNTIYADGNFTTGIASTMDMIFITNNTIAANGTNVGTPAGYDTMGIETIGVHIVDGDALVKYNNITSNSEYTVSVEGTGAVTDNNLIAINYTGDASVDSIPGDTLVANNTPAMQRAIVTADDVVLYYKNGTRYVILLTDQNGNALPNETVTITINGVPYDRTTDEKGIASIAINLPSGNYTASVLYVGKGDFTNTTSENNVTVLSTIYGDDLVKVFRNGTQYYATFVDGQGNPLAHGTDVTFNINGVFYTRQINGTEGKAKLNINLEQGEYIITAYHPVSGEMHSNIITVLPLIQSNDLVKYFRNESQFVVTVFGADGNPVGAGEDVTFNINGVFYTRQTNESGQAKLNINLEQGNYTITTMYNGCNVANNIEVLPILYAQDLIMKQGTSDQFRAKLFDGQGNPYPGQNITFNIHGIFYQRTTDSDGWAALNIKLSAVADTYIITSMYNGCTISNKIVIEPA